jgi:hypothetical protein
MILTWPSLRLTKSRFDPSGAQASPVTLPRFTKSVTKTDSLKFGSRTVPALIEWLLLIPAANANSRQNHEFTALTFLMMLLGICV